MISRKKLSRFDDLKFPINFRESDQKKKKREKRSSSSTLNLKLNHEV